MSGSTALNGRRRSTELAELGDGADLDVVVIGGGITGVGVALDAVTRGLAVALVEKHDLAFGTSRWSSKLVHGGLRYLASGHIGIARRSALERHILMTRTAPHLVHAMPQLVPLLPEMNTAARALVRVGFAAGDGLRRMAGTSPATLPRSRRIAARQAMELAPTVRTRGLDGALLGYDGQLIDDARLVAAVARTAAQHGAKILTRVAASQASGTSVTLTDTLSGETMTVTARVVVNATGVWAGQVDPSIAVRPSRGTHLVFDSAAFGGAVAALTIPIPGEINRFVFAMPEQLGRVYLGLTDEDAPGPIPDVPQPTPQEVSFLLDTVNTALEVALTPADVIGSYAGLRPLIDTTADTTAAGAPRGKAPGRTADVSREHAVVKSESGVISVIGGKLTEYRYMAEDVVDHAIRHGRLAAGPCRTRNMPLVGASANPVGTLRPPAGLPDSLVARYGAEAPNVIAQASCERPTDPVADGIDITRAEFEYAVTHEGALSVEDILDRRTRIGLVAGDRARAEPAASEILTETASRQQ